MIGMIEVEVRHHPTWFWYSSVEYCTTQDETMSNVYQFLCYMHQKEEIVTNLLAVSDLLW